jgi:hypothetical protein
MVAYPPAGRLVGAVVAAQLPVDVGVGDGPLAVHRPGMDGQAIPQSRAGQMGQK